MNIVFKMLIVSLLLIYGLNSCISSDGYTVSSFYIKNDVNIPIKILPSKTMIDTLKLKNYEILKFKQGSMMGKGSGINLAFFADENSVTVIFNSKDTIKHYNDTLSHLGNYYNLKSERCFYNPQSYTKKIEPIGTESNDVTLTYTITEQDYIDAKK